MDSPEAVSLASAYSMYDTQPIDRYEGHSGKQASQNGCPL